MKMVLSGGMRPDAAGASLAPDLVATTTAVVMPIRTTAAPPSKPQNQPLEYSGLADSWLVKVIGEMGCGNNSDGLLTWFGTALPFRGIVSVGAKT